MTPGRGVATMTGQSTSACNSGPWGLQLGRLVGTVDLGLALFRAPWGLQHADAPRRVHPTVAAIRAPVGAGTA